MLASDWPMLLTLSSHGSGRSGLHPHHDHHRVRGPVEHGHQDHHEEHRPQVQVYQVGYYSEDQMIVKCQHHNRELGIYTRNDKMTRRCRREKLLYKSWGTRKGWCPLTWEGQGLMGLLAVFKKNRPNS